jgi:putative ABC transport system permease protein
MIKSYLKIALRYLAKNKVYSFINIAGLSLSLACAMVIVLYIKDELSFDRFHKNASSIYLIGTDVRFADGSSMDKFGVTSGFHGPRFKANLPEIESFVRLRSTYLDLKHGDVIQSHRIMQADSNFFSFFTFPLLYGNPQAALSQPHGVVISEDFAKSYL